MAFWGLWGGLGGQLRAAPADMGRLGAHLGEPRRPLGDPLGVPGGPLGEPWAAMGGSLGSSGGDFEVHGKRCISLVKPYVLKHEAVLGGGLGAFWGATGWLGEPFGTFGVLSGSLGGAWGLSLSPSEIGRAHV